MWIKLLSVKKIRFFFVLLCVTKKKTFHTKCTDKHKKNTTSETITELGGGGVRANQLRIWSFLVGNACVPGGLECWECWVVWG
uniref:Uncharacterized protein n=1 Tax=Gasterosteus aculeatus TaxID=69293 RepID=G3QCJ4_GASAC